MVVAKVLDPGFRRGDDFLRVRHDSFDLKVAGCIVESGDPKKKDKNP
jgi:hypothetical protein